MRYLVNRKTKEHQRMPFDCLYAPSGWSVVQADDGGWIKHEGDECPLPDDVRCEVRINGDACVVTEAKKWRWTKNKMGTDITHYRPILTERVQEPEPTKPKRLFDDLLERLEASHAAAQALPDLVEQLRDRLKPMSLSVMYLSEFDAVEPEPAVETPQANALCTPSVTDALVYGTSVMKNGKHVPLKDFYAEPAEDMSDWRNWREGDKIECIAGGSFELNFSMIYVIANIHDTGYVSLIDCAHAHFWSCFRFHSRPAKGE